MKLFRTINEIINYKQIKRDHYRMMRDKYGYGWQCLEAANMHCLGRYPHRIATYYSQKCVDIDTTKKSSYRLWKEDRKAKEAFNAMYPGSVELFG